MAQVLVTEGYLTDIANAIRAKNGTATKYKPSEMAAAITALSTSSSSGGSSSGGSSSGGSSSGGSDSGTTTGKTKLGSFSVQATAEGALTGYTIGKLTKVIPNNKTVHFKVVIYCPTGLLIDMMAISDFKTGRAWGRTNSYCSDFVETAVDSGKNYTMEWDEPISVTTYLSDDDQSNNLVTYYCCSESKVKQASGSTTDLASATLTVEAYV